MRHEVFTVNVSRLDDRIPPEEPTFCTLRDGAPYLYAVNNLVGVNSAEGYGIRKNPFQLPERLHTLPDFSVGLQQTIRPIHSHHRRTPTRFEGRHTGRTGPC